MAGQYGTQHAIQRRAGGDRPLPKALPIDLDYLKRVMLSLLEHHSPTGYTDQVVHLVCDELTALGVEYELTRRGAIRATLPGARSAPDRAVVAHLDTIGAMVCGLKPNGRLGVTPIGSWSARFAEGAEVTVLTGEGARSGTILPLKASGHAFDEEVDTQGVSWDNVELRLDELVHDRAGLEMLGVAIGDYVGIDTQARITDSGFVKSRHLDDKAGVAALLTAVKAVLESGVRLPVDCHPLFTISEEVGVGASGVLHQDVAELVAIDTAPQAPGQASLETCVTVSMKDSSGPFDWHLNRLLLELARENGIDHLRDVFRFYRCDAAAALEAGNDIRTALICFGTDATHGYERTHLSALEGLTRLLTAYMQAPPAVPRDREQLGPPEGFPSQPEEEAAFHAFDKPIRAVD